MSLLLSLPLAWAIVPPQWNWPDSTVRYHGELQLLHPYGEEYRAVENLEIMAGAIAVTADFECTSHPEEDIRVVDCTFAWFDVASKAMKAENQDKLNQIMAEWNQNIKTYTVEMTFGLNGKMKTMDLKNVNRINQRAGSIIEQQRLLLLKLFDLLDMPLPETEKEWNKGWKSKGWIPQFLLLSVNGTAGSMKVSHVAKEPRNGYLFIETEGHASVNTNSGVDTNSAAMVDCIMGGSTLLDEKTGLVFYRNMVVNGMFTASVGINSNKPFYEQSAAIQQVEAFTGDGSAPKFVPADQPAETPPAETPPAPTPPAETPPAPTPPAPQ